ncbi:MAG: hypothetical protein E6R13_09055 [Spirochaetes bacterium]|nr:MAG: hypothetical protein E6R13_09055 [Spirochaetota bacterium]
MKRNSLLLVLLLTSWTVLFGQVPGSQYGPPIKDSMTCYTPTELRAVAMSLVNGQECDTLLKIAHQAIVYKDTTIASQKRTIEKQEVRQLDTEHLADEYKGQKEAAEQALKDEQKKKKWILAGWGSTTIILLTLTFLALL